MQRAESNTGITPHIGASETRRNTAGCSRSATALPAIRKRIEEDLKLPGLPKNKVLATIVKLLERTCMRIGNDEYVKQNESYGLTTLQDEHVKVDGSKMRFKFRGKSGQQQDIELEDPRIAKIVKKCRDIPGWELFQYFDEAGEKCRHHFNRREQLHPRHRRRRLHGERLSHLGRHRMGGAGI